MSAQEGEWRCPMLRNFHGPLRHNPVNPRYFTDDTGEAVFLTGSHTWASMNDMWLDGEPRQDMDYPGFLQMMSDHGHNFMRFWQFNMQSRCAPWNEKDTLFDPQPFLRTGPGKANDGLLKYDLEKPNPFYYERLVQRLRMAADKGIYASVMLFEAWAVKWATPGQNAWTHYPFHPQNNVNGCNDDARMPDGRAWKMFSLDCPKILAAQKRYVREVVTRVNALENVLFEICNEIPFTPEAMSWQEEMCRYVRSVEKDLPNRHPVGITAEGGDQDNRDLFATSADWISPSNGEVFEYRYNPPAADGSKVVVNDTDHLWGHGCDTGWIWKSFLRGHNVLFMDPWEPIPGDLDWWQDGDVSRNQRYYHVWDDARRNMGYARRLSLMFDMNRCMPIQTACTSTYCLAWEGEQYLAYFPAGGFEGLDLRKAKGVYQVSWLDPATGITHPGKPLNGGTRQALCAPFPGPSVLLCYRNRKELPKRHAIYREKG